MSCFPPGVFDTLAFHNPSASSAPASQKENASAPLNSIWSSTATAKALGLTIPDKLLALADTVIE
jgi:hypothetical protein